MREVCVYNSTTVIRIMTDIIQRVMMENVTILDVRYHQDALPFLATIVTTMIMQFILAIPNYVTTKITTAIMRLTKVGYVPIGVLDLVVLEMIQQIN